MISCFVRYGYLHSIFPCFSHVTHFVKLQIDIDFQRETNRHKSSKKQIDTKFQWNSQTKFLSMCNKHKDKNIPKTHINIDLQIHRQTQTFKHTNIELQIKYKQT
jgi:hypothetical protein